MFNITINRETLLGPLQQVSSVVERNQTMPILSHVKLQVQDNTLRLQATDLEIEITATAPLIGDFEACSVAIPARKLFDICKSLPANADITIQEKEQNIRITSGDSQFSLAILPHETYPSVDAQLLDQSLTLSSEDLYKLLKKTAFSMANDDVRYFLNGLLLEVGEGHISAVATDGHRLALSKANIESTLPKIQLLVPKKAVNEMLKLLAQDDTQVTLSFGHHHIQVQQGETTITSKLVDARYPDYQRVIPDACNNTLVANTHTLRDALKRTAILSDEQYRGIRMKFSANKIQLYANNAQQGQAEDCIGVQYTGGEIDVGFNVNYLLDILSAVEDETVHFSLQDANSSARLTTPSAENELFVVMPMRL